MPKRNYNRIKELLSKHVRTSRELAEYVGVHEQTVSGWCRNQIQPEFPRLYQVADFFGIEAGELLTLKKDLRQVKEIAKPAKTKSPEKRLTGVRETETSFAPGYAIGPATMNQPLRPFYETRPTTHFSIHPAAGRLGRTDKRSHYTL